MTKIQQGNKLKIVEYLFILFTLKKTPLLMVSLGYLCQNMPSKPVSMDKYDFWKVYYLAKCMWTFPNMTRCTSSAPSYVPAQYQIPLSQKEARSFFIMVVAKTHAGPTEACKSEWKILNSDPVNSKFRPWQFTKTFSHKLLIINITRMSTDHL